MPSFAAFEDELPAIAAKYVTWADDLWARVFRMRLNQEQGLGSVMHRDESDIGWVTWRMQALLAVDPLESAVVCLKNEAVRWATFLALQDIQQNARMLPSVPAARLHEICLKFQQARERAQSIQKGCLSELAIEDHNRNLTADLHRCFT
jgi:hypothetical protein